MATATKPQKARGKRQKATLPAPLKIERLDVPLPPDYTAWVEVGQLDDRQWCWGYGANGGAMGTSMACRRRDGEPAILSRPQAVAEGLRALALFASAQRWPAEVAQKISDLRVADWGDVAKLIDSRREVACEVKAEAKPPAAPVVNGHGDPSHWRDLIPPGATSTTTPAGIAANDPDAIPDTPPNRAPGPGLLVEKRLPRCFGITIDPEFQAALRSPTADELAALRADLDARGCIDPLIVWLDEGIETNRKTGARERVRAPSRTLVDGHNRYRMCDEAGIPVAIVELTFASRAEALEWLYKHQVARRNVSAAERDAILARDYRAEVERRKEGRKNGAQREPGGDGKGTRGQGDKGTPHSETVTPPNTSKKAAAVVAEKHGVSAATVKRAAKKQRRRSALLDDKRLNDSGVYVRGIRKVHVPLPSSSKCTAEIRLVEQLDGTWVYGYDFTRHGANLRARSAAPTLDLDGGYRSREECLLAAAHHLKTVAQHPQDPWPANAIKTVRAWTDSLERPKPERERRDEATRHIERYLDTLDSREAWDASDYLLDALNQWRGRHGPKSKTKRKPR